MEENVTITVTRGRRQKKGSNTIRTSVAIPEYLLKIIDEEAKEKDKTRANVIVYLIISGLKAHTGEFFFPGKNTIKANWLKRGRTWYMKEQ